MATQENDISKQVRAALEVDPRVDLHRFPINVMNNGSGLRLEGEVPSLAAKRVAMGLARRVSGMERVIDALRLVATDPRGDGEIRDAFVRGLLQQPELRNCTLSQRNKGQVEVLHEETIDDAPSGEIVFGVDDGELVLDGHMLSLSHKRMVEAIAWWTPGSRNVVNRIEVVPAEADNDDELADAIRLVLEMDPLVRADQVGIRAEQGAVTLAGALRSDEERHMAEMDAWSVDGVTDVHNRIEVRPG
jgi:osmotically-inducible protein OsmY